MNQRKLVALVVVAVVAVIITGGLTASNMGVRFQLFIKHADNAPIPPGTANPDCATVPAGPTCVSNSGTQSLGYPYHRQGGIDKASRLFRDIGLTISTCGKNPCNCLLSVQRYDTLTDNNAPYGCGTTCSPGCGPVNLFDFDLESGSGVLVQAKNSQGNPVVAHDGDYLIVGSHNPTLIVNLPGAGAASNSGTERYAHPWHAISTKASEVIAEMGGCRTFPDAPDVSDIQRYDEASDQNQPYGCGVTCDPPGPVDTCVVPGVNDLDFTLEPGRAYLVNTGPSTTEPAGLNFVPAHY